MPNKTFAEIQASFDALLQELVTVEQVVTEVKFGRTALLEGHPALRYYIISVDTRHVSQRDYRRGWGFKIEIVQESSQQIAAVAEMNLGNALDALFNKLEENWDLDSDILDDPTAVTSEDTTESGKVVTATIIAIPRTFTKY